MCWCHWWTCWSSSCDIVLGRLDLFCHPLGPKGLWFGSGITSDGVVFSLSFNVCLALMVHLPKSMLTTPFVTQMDQTNTHPIYLSSLPPGTAAVLCVQPLWQLDSGWRKPGENIHVVLASTAKPPASGATHSGAGSCRDPRCTRGASGTRAVARTNRALHPAWA